MGEFGWAYVKAALSASGPTGSIQFRDDTDAEGKAGLTGSANFIFVTGSGANVQPSPGELRLTASFNMLGNMALDGDLTVLGHSTIVSASHLIIADAVIGLGFGTASNHTGAAGDRGFIFGITGNENQAFYWDNSSGSYMLGKVATVSPLDQGVDGGVSGSIALPEGSYGILKTGGIRASGSNGVVFGYKLESSGPAMISGSLSVADRVAIGVSTTPPGSHPPSGSALLTVQGASASGVPTLFVDHDDDNVVGVDVNLANTTAIGIDIDASNTTAAVLDITANALTTGAALNILTTATNDNAGSLVRIAQDGSRAGSAASIGLDVDFNTAANANARAFRIDSEQTTGIVAEINGDALTTGTAIDVSTDARTTGTALSITDGATNDSAGSLVTIAQIGSRAGSAASIGLDVDFNTVANVNARAFRIASLQSTGIVAEINADGLTTGTGIDLSTDARTTGTALSITDSATGDNAGSLVTIAQIGSRAGSAASIGLDVDFNTVANANARAFRIDSEQTTGIVAEINADGLTTGTGIDLSTDARTTGTALNISDSATGDAAGSLVKIAQIGSRAGSAASIGLDVDFNTVANANARAFRIGSLQTTGIVAEIDADAITTGTGISLSADALTTGTALRVADNSSNTGTRNTVEIIQDNVAAVGATALKIQSDSNGPVAALSIDRNAAGVAAVDAITGIAIDLDQTGEITSATGVVVGVDTNIETNVAGDGTLNAYGHRVVMTGDTDGTHSHTGLSINAGAADTNTHIELLHATDPADKCTIAVGASGETTIATVDVDAAAANMLFTIDGLTKFTSLGVEIENASAAGVPALLIDNNDVDEHALLIDAANTTVQVAQIKALNTTSNVIEVTGSALTTGGLMHLQSNSTDTSARTLFTLINDAPEAVGVQMAHFRNDAIGGAGDPILLIESTAAETDALLELRNSNAATDKPPILVFNRSDDTGEADDMSLGTIKFHGVDAGNNPTDFITIDAIASDIVESKEGGKLTFNVFAGGTAGTAASANLFSIGGEDASVAGTCEVVVNDAGIDCNFRVESDDETHMLFVDAGNNRVSIGDDTDGTTATFEVTNANHANFDTTLVQLNNNEADQIALDINAVNTTVNVLDIAANAVTTANIINISADDGLTTGKVIAIDHNDAATTAVAPVGISYDFDKDGDQGDGVTSGYTGIQVNMADAATGNHNNSNVTMIGMDIDVDSAAVTSGGTGTNTNVGLDITCTDAAINAGIVTTVENGATNADIKMQSSADTGDYAVLAVDANGALKIATVDDDGANGHMELAPDGDLQVTPTGGNIVFHDGSNGIFDFDVAEPTLTIKDDGQVANYCSIAVGANGATTFTTVDADAAVANLTFTVDGAIKLDGAGVEIENDSATGAPALLIDNDDTDQVALSIAAANIDAAVVYIEADAVTTAAGLYMTADSLTTGAGISVASTSTHTGGASALVKFASEGNRGHDSNAHIGLFIDYNSTAGAAAKALYIDSEQTTGIVIDLDASAITTGKAQMVRLGNLSTGIGLKLDHNDTSTGAVTPKTFHIDFDKTGDMGAATAVYTAQKIDMHDASTDNNGSADVTMIGLDIDVDSAGTAGAMTNIGMDIGVTDADINVGIMITAEDGAGSDIEMKSSANPADSCTIAVGAEGATTITTVDADSAVAHLVFTIDGNVGVGTTAPKVHFDVHHNPTALSNDTGGGDVITFGTEDTGGSAHTLAAGKLMYMNTSGVWKYADADAVASSGGVLLAIALGTAVSDGLLIKGYFDANTIQGSFVKGGVCYVSESEGVIDFTAPTAPGDVVRVVGYGTNTANVIYFDPSGDWIEL